LHSLLYLVEDPDFENLPAVFFLITPFLRSTPSSLRHDLVDLLEKLALRSPQETAFILRSAIGVTNNSDAAWLTRQMLSIFPPEIGNDLRQAMKNQTNKR
jgi:hypothetical protein